MSETTEKIRRAIQLASTYGFEIPDNISNEISGIETPTYRVAVVGKFQVGKSTLINRVFLGDNPILLEGNGLCTTSVTTEVGYGSTPRLEVYQWNDESKTSDSMTQAMDNPSQDILKSATVGDDRVALANKISKVKFFTPNEKLKKYILLDTPGIDDPNPDILQNTTYRIIPSSDLAIVVVEARMLDQVELKLLRKNLIKDGIARLMVLISYRPEDGTTAEKRAQIIETVKAQLADIGKEDIPVEMYCFNEAIDDILCTVSEISLKINSFLAENALAGREAHVSAHVREFLTNCLLGVATQLKAHGQSAAENEELKKKVSAQAQEIQAQCNSLLVSLQQDFEAIKHNAHGFVENKVRSVFADFREKLHSAEDLKSVQTMLENADETLKLKLGDAIDECARKIEQEVRNVLSSKTSEIQNIAMSWDSFLQGEIDINVGFMAKIPSFVMEIGNIIILDILLPFGFVFAIFGRIFQSILPILKKLTLQNLLKSIILSKADSALTEAIPQVVNMIYKQICGNLDTAVQKVGETIRAKFTEQSKTVMSSLDSAAPVGTAELDAAKAEIQNAIDTLQ